MTLTSGRSVPVGTAVEAVLEPQRVVAGTPVKAIRRPERIVFGAPLAAAIVGAAVGGGALFVNGIDAFTVPALGLLGLSLLAALVYARSRSGDSWDRTGLLLAGLCLGVAVLLPFVPEWLYGGQINGIVHRSVVSAALVLVLSAFVCSRAVRSLLGGTPNGQDLALYPVLALPVTLALVGYGLVLGRVVVAGAGGLRLDLLTTAWQEDLVQQGETYTFAYQVGFLNNILGTLLLVGMTSLIAILPGVGAGWFMSEYPGRLARVIDFCTTMLRAVSVFIIGAAAFGLVHVVADQPAGSFLSDLIRGSYRDPGGIHPGSGSFLTASLFLALLVIPIIAKLTEEGLRSIPRDIREGSVALGAAEGYGLRRILLPWAAPSILTGLLLAAAEASGSLAVIIFIAGPGQHGVGPTSIVTSLDFAVFATQYGPRTYVETMGEYRYTAALLLLLLTLGLTLVAMWLRRRTAERYRGSLVAG